MQTMRAKAAKRLRIPKRVRPDDKHRVGLGSLTDGVSSFTIKVLERGAILLTPNKEVPAAEAWLWENKSALAAVQEGLAQSARGETKYLGSFAKFADD
jgi:hypothetical protein